MKFKKQSIFSILLLAAAGFFGISSAVVNAKAEDNPVVEEAEASTHSAQTYYYCNIDREDASKTHTCQWGWWGATYTNVWLQYSTDGGSNWSYAAPADISTTTITLGSETINVRKWKYVTGATNFQWYCWNTDKGNNRAENIALSGRTDGKNVYCVNSYKTDDTSEQTGYWEYYVESTTKKRTYYLDASAWGVTSSTTSTLFLHWWDPNNSSTTFGDVTPTEYYADGVHQYKFYAAELTGDYYFAWYHNNWANKTADLNPYAYSADVNNLCIADSAAGQAGSWLMTNGTVQKFIFYKYIYNEATWIQTNYLLNGESFDLENISLPSESVTGWNAPSVWNEGSFDGTERAWDYSYSNVDQNYSLYGTYIPGAGKVIPNDKVRLWVTYYNSQNSSGDYFDRGDNKDLIIVLWVHSTSEGGTEKLYSSQNSSVWHTYNNSSQSNRRYDYFDIDLSCYTSGWYLTIQRLDPDTESNWGQTSNDSTHKFQLSSTNVGKVHSISWDSTNSCWYIASESAGTATNTVDAQLAVRALAGLHTCTSNVYNGSKAFNNTRDTFINPNGGSTWYTNGNISDWYIYDFDKWNTSYDVNYESLGIDGYTKYEWLNYYCNGGVEPSPVLGSFKPVFLGEADNDLTIMIIVIASSVSLLSITALSILLVKKKKYKQN